MDLALDTDGDLLLVDGDAVLVTGVDSLRQRIEVSLSVLLGEWYLDVTAGVDWLGAVLVRTPDFVELDAIFRSRLAEVPGVDSVVALDFELDDDRRLLVSFEVEAESGETVSATFTLDGDGDVLAILSE